MRAVLAIALKDLRLLARDRAGLFFVLGWPLIVAILFGLAFGGGGGGNAKPEVALLDLDDSVGSRDFIKTLQGIEELRIDVAADANAARELVRTGQRVAAITIPKGYGELALNLFYGTPPVVEVLVDPSRKAEQAMLVGMLQRAGGQRMSQMMSAPRDGAWLARAREQTLELPENERAPMLKLLDAVNDLPTATPPDAEPGGAPANQTEWIPLDVHFQSVARRRDGPENSFAITFPQGLLWGMLGCLMSFATSLVLERMQGTLVRLYASPMSPARILLGKGLACFLAIVMLGSLMMAMAAFVFGVRPTSWTMLLLGIAACAFAFTGIMMVIAGLGRTTQAVSGAGWALLMPLMLFGGAMIPSFAMPAWMRQIGNFSPMHWASLAIEGGLWRDFSFVEMLPALGVLAAVGGVCLWVGARRFNRRAAYL